MGKYLFFSVFFFIALFFIQCNRVQSTIPVINLYTSAQSDTLRFSDVADNTKIVPLETLDDTYLSSSNLRYWVGDKYILALNDKAVLQFSPDGKFICRLASQGKGPNEYQYMGICTVDEENDILYFTSQTNFNEIYSIDLESGEFKESVNIKEFGTIRGMSIKDGNLLLFPEKPVIYFITPDGTLIDSLALGDIPEDELIFFTEYPTYFSGGKEKTFFELRDTIFELDFPNYKPVATFTYKDKFNTRTNLNGKSKKIKFTNSKYFFLTSLDVEMERYSGTGYSIQTRFRENYILNKENFTLKDIDNFIYLDFWDIQAWFYSLDITGSKTFVFLEPLYIKTQIEKKKEKGEFINPKLEQLANSLKEEDNPVLIIGNSK